METARSIISRTAQKHAVLGVAVSGGADSMCLLHLVLSAVEPSRVVVLNVEHGIRGESSVADTEFVRRAAESAGVRFVCRSADVPTLVRKSKRSEESEARLFRRAFFRECVENGTADVVLTAHNAGDRTEAILMHILRGCGTHGLVGMTAENGEFVRPLLGVTRAEIERYCAQNGVEYVTDETNSDTKYTRNFLRIEILPRLRERYAADAALETLSENAACDEDFIRSQLDFGAYITEEGGVVGLRTEALSLHRALSARYVVEAAARAGRRTDLTAKHIDAILALATEANGSRVMLGGGLAAAREYDRIAFYTDEEPERDEAPFAVGLTPFGSGTVRVLPTQPVWERGRLVADGDKIPVGAVVRYRREGDRFKPFGSGTKKLKEFFIDRKIPLRKRDKIPLLCYNDRVLAVFGVEIADELRLSPDTVNALELDFTEDI